MQTRDANELRITKNQVDDISGTVHDCITAINALIYEKHEGNMGTLVSFALPTFVINMSVDQDTFVMLLKFSLITHYYRNGYDVAITEGESGPFITVAWKPRLDKKTIGLMEGTIKRFTLSGRDIGKFMSDHEGVNFSVLSGESNIR